MKEEDVRSQLFPEEREMYQTYFYEEGQRSGRRKGLAAGRAAGMHESLLATYEARFGQVPAAIRRADRRRRTPRPCRCAGCRRTRPRRGCGRHSGW